MCHALRPQVTQDHHTEVNDIFTHQFDREQYTAETIEYASVVDLLLFKVL